MTQQQVLDIHISNFIPSATNPRKHIGRAELEELARSISEVGILSPLRVRRRDGDTFEIICGERRWRAAQLAGREHVPAIVQDMTDQQAQEIQLIDNLQRADLGPMEEAEGYHRLWACGGFPSIEMLAAKAGKTEAYVLQRIKLLALIPEGRDALRAQVLNLTLALIIARLQESDQEKALLYAVDPKHILKGNLAERIASARQKVADDEHWYRCATETEMRAWLKANILLTLKGVAWRLEDVDLIPGAGDCMTCPKRAGNNAALFGEMAAEGDTCTDPACYAKKAKAAVKEAVKSEPHAIRLAASQSHMPVKEGATKLKAGQWVEAKEGSCPAVIRGVTEDGHIKTVCPNQQCKTHKHHVVKPLEKGESAASWEEQQKARRAKEDAYVAAETPVRKAVYAAIRPKLKGAKLLRLACQAVKFEPLELADLRGIPRASGEPWDVEAAAKKDLAAKLAKLKDADLEGWLADAVASAAIWVDRHDATGGRENLWAIGKLVGVDCDAIASKVQAAKPGAAAAKKATNRGAK